MSQPYYLYIIECNNGTLYTGIALDPEKRYKLHCAGQGAKYTRAFPPKRLAAVWEVADNRAGALSIEASVKKLPRADKQRLVNQPEKLDMMIKLQDTV